MSQTLEDRRQTPRQGIARVAKIQLGNGGKPLYCIVTDVSDGGVRIHANEFEVPDEFGLLLDDNGPSQVGTYKVIWRRDGEVGAKLVSVT